MKILDFRPWPTRLVHSLWQGNTGPVEGLASPANIGSKIFADLISRITRHRIQGRPQVPPTPFIVSVGNLALGGTGKTPVVSALARDLAGFGFTGAILTRGYRSPLAGPLMVQPGLVEAGDEARLLAAEIQSSGWSVIQARDRLAGLKWAQGLASPWDIIIAEDAHQTPNLPRHLDIVIVDRWRLEHREDSAVVAVVTGPIFPFGPYRENATGADRAGIWLLEDEGTGYQRPVGQAQDSVTTFRREIILPAQISTGQRYGILSGIARPHRFEKELIRQIGPDPELVFRCSDHDVYNPALVRKIVAAAQKAQLSGVLTTAKDWVKLQDVWPGELPLLVADLRISWGQGKTLPELVREHFKAHTDLLG